MKMTAADVIWASIDGGSARALGYDFVTRRGTLHIAEGTCCGMLDCVRLFVGIDPQVRLIETIAGEKPDTSYHRSEDGRWLRLMSHPAPYAAAGGSPGSRASTRASAASGFGSHRDKPTDSSFAASSSALRSSITSGLAEHGGVCQGFSFRVRD
jgi:hypothetical protein